MSRSVVVLLVLVACTPSDSGETSSGSSETTAAVNPEPHARFSGTVDVAGLCGGAAALSMHAIKVGCATAGPCTIKVDPFLEFAGDAVTCPDGQGGVLAVEVLEAGRYQIEVRADGGEPLCFGVGGETSQVVTAEDLEGRASFEVAALGGPCPAP